MKWRICLAAVVSFCLLGAGPATGPATRPASQPAASAEELTKRVEAAKARVAKATDRIAQIKASAGTKAESSPAVKAALADIAAKEKALAVARQSGTPQQKLDASSAYNKARAGIDKVKADAAAAALAATDREVKPAEAELHAAEGQLRSAEGELAAVEQREAATEATAQAAATATAMKSNRLVPVPGGGEMFIYVQSPVVHLASGRQKEQPAFAALFYRDPSHRLNPILNDGDAIKAGQAEVPVSIKSDNLERMVIENGGMYGMRFTFRQPGEVNLVVSFSGTEVKIPIQVVDLPFNLGQEAKDLVAKYGPPDSKEKMSVTYPLFKNLDGIAYSPLPGGSMDTEHWRFKQVPYAVFSIGGGGTELYRVGSFDREGAAALDQWKKAAGPPGPTTRRGTTPAPAGRGGATPRGQTPAPGRGGRR